MNIVLFSMTVPIKCKTLLGHSGLEFSITCLKSFINNAKQEIHLQIFEDGTLTPADRQQLLAKLPNSNIIDKNVRDQQVAEKLNNYPSCLYYRNSTGYAQKLFDIMLYDDADVFYIDSDILFLKKFCLPQFNEIPVFMSDTFNAYSFQPWDFIRIKFPIFPYVNSGFFYFPQKMYDLDFIEQLLNDTVIRNGFINKIPWLEQTLWAFLTAKSKSFYYFDYNQIMMAQQIMKIPVKANLTEDIIAVHLVGSLRGHVFPELQSIPPPAADDNNYLQIRLMVHNRYLNNISFGIDRLKKKWRQMRPKKFSNYQVNVTR